MAFDDLVRNLVAVADTLTAPLQATVAWSAFTGQDHGGNPTYATAVNVQCVIEQKLEQRTLADGRIVSTRAKLTFPRSFNVDARDKLVLPDGSSSPIVDLQGVTDPDAAGLPYAQEVYLGVDRTVS